VHLDELFSFQFVRTASLRAIAALAIGRPRRTLAFLLSLAEMGLTQNMLTSFREPIAA
jgi:hypothetical protein